VFLPIHDTQKLTECFRRRVIAQFLRKNLITESFSEMLLSWRHSGFSVNNSVRMAGDDHKARMSLAQYIARAPLSLEKLHDDQQDGKAFYHSTYNPYLGENLKVWDALDFLALATSFIPPQGVRLIRYFGLYSSRSRWQWPLWQHADELGLKSDGFGFFESVCDFDAGMASLWCLKRAIGQGAHWPTAVSRPELPLSKANADAFRKVLDAASEADLQRIVSYTTSRGDRFTSALGDILLHVAMHCSYHRGQVAFAVRSGGA
jgi:hypothetical protein